MIVFIESTIASIYEISYNEKWKKDVLVAKALSILIASSTEAFLQRFERAFQQAGLDVLTVTDGFEALTLLEEREFDLLLVNGGEIGQKPGLSGIAGDELSHMWRQIEGRAAHLVIGYVSNVEMRQAARSRFVSNPANLARNRGVDHHFWNDEEDDRIVTQLVGELVERRRHAGQTVVSALDGNVVLMANSDGKNQSDENVESKIKKGEQEPPS